MQSLGKLETQFFAWQQLSAINKVKTGDVSAALNISSKQERELLSRLKRKGFIIRLRKGLYLSPKTIPPGGIWQPTELVILETLMKDYCASYQISGPFAFQYYGLTEQISNELFVYNDRISGRRSISAASFLFAKVNISRIGNDVNLGDTSVQIGNLARILFDAVYDYKRFNSLPIAYSWIAERRGDKKLMDELLSCALEYGNIGTLRRLGYILETMNCPARKINRLESQINDSKSVIPFDPTQPKRGKISKHWGLVINNTTFE